MKEPSPAHQHYPRDFLAETIQMSATEAGVYIWLRGECWMNGGFVLNEKSLALATKCPRVVFRNSWKHIAHLFKETPDGIWIHEGMESERNKQLEYRNGRSEAGKAGAESRWHSHPKNMAEPFSSNGKSMANYGSASATASATASEAAEKRENMVDYREYPKTAGAITKLYHTVDTPMLSAIIHAAVQQFVSEDHPKIGNLTDADIAEAVTLAAKESPKQNSAALFLRTVPAVISNWVRHGRQAESNGIYKRFEIPK